MGKKESIQPYEGPKDDPRTGIESPHVLETPSVVAAMSREQTPDGSLVPIHHGRRHHLDVHRIRQTGNGAKAGGQLIDRGCVGRLGDRLARG